MNRLLIGVTALSILAVGFAFLIYGLPTAIMVVIVATPIAIILGVLNEGTPENTIAPPAQEESSQKNFPKK